MEFFQPQTEAHLKALTWASLVMASVSVGLVAILGTRAEAQSRPYERSAGDHRDKGYGPLEPLLPDSSVESVVQPASLL